MKWPDGTPATGTSPDERVMIEDLNNLCQEFFLSQIINKPTHKDGNTLDLVLTNNVKLIHSYQCIDAGFEIRVRSSQIANRFFFYANQESQFS